MLTKNKISNKLGVGLIAVLMICCAFPFLENDDTVALTGNSEGMSLNTESEVIYVSGTPNSTTLTVSTTLSGVDVSQAVWTVKDLDDGTDCVSLSATSGSTTTVSAVAFTDGASVKTVEVVATVGANYASAVIVIYPNTTDTAQVFHFYVKIDESVLTTSRTPQAVDELDSIKAGMWVSVAKTDFEADSNNANANWNAMNAFKWYCSTHSWNCDIGSMGWINTVLGLGTYEGDNGAWIYWAQYHANGDGWVFNNTTMAYITSVGSCYIGLIFWSSPDADTMPTFPGYPKN